MSLTSRKIVRSAVILAAPALMLAAGACTTPFRADVARFQQLPPPQGQTFSIRPADTRMEGGLEFQQYAALVSQELSRQGYQPAQGRGGSLVVTLNYGVDQGHEKVVTTPGFGPGFGRWGGYGGFGYGGFGHSGYRWGRFGGRFGYGWADPFWYDPWGYPDVRSYTYYVSFLTMEISRAADGRKLFEGRARARSTTSQLTTLVPNLVEAMFTGFPGRSGEEIRITVPPPQRSATAPRDRPL